jgi:hypothetical protein
MWKLWETLWKKGAGMRFLWGDLQIPPHPQTFWVKGMFGMSGMFLLRFIVGGKNRRYKTASHSLKKTPTPF